jgi:hypothetical protein
MKKIIFILIMALFCIAIFNQCRKKKLLGTYSFTQEELNIIPYQGGETIMLVDSLGDTIKYAVRNPRVNNYTIIYRPGDDNYSEYYKTEENVTSADGTFKIYLCFSSPFDPPVMKYIRFSCLLIDNHPELGRFSGYLEFNASKLFHTGQIYPLYGSNLYVYTYDTIKLNNKYFYSVYELSGSFPVKDTVDGIKTIYYSITQGIVGIKTKYNRIWCLN